ncbi:RibD family protein [Roseofilum casamattae]|uniref:RibD family protein n=1 Tax=Roseofilum casamattae BLCC-M143 TaxID=3022442 RepID=A0ABT7BY53_9CYAN|nr:RibD family protein [Roseofilum casamattae]MDJ1184123.1 RibD family protein [Roseofilum casamattae BLCC-M143]
MKTHSLERPHITAVLAMSADGKIADAKRSPARFGSVADKTHLEQQIARVDGVLFGAGTLRAYGTTLSISNPQLLDGRINTGYDAQPVQIVVSQTAEINPNLRFFQQPVPRWLITTEENATQWQGTRKFNQILTAPTHAGGFYWNSIFLQLSQLDLKQLAILGGGELMASLLAGDWIDEIWLTVCPAIFGGARSPTPVDGLGLSIPKSLELLSARPLRQEVFLHYRVLHDGSRNG